MTLERTVQLRFDADAVRSGTHVNLSAVRVDGELLWIAGDETATVERLTCDNAQRPAEYGRHVSFPLADVLSLPGKADEEADIEGISRNGPYLWVIGSHSAKRRKVKADHSAAKAVKRLASVLPEPARRVLARVALTGDEPTEATPDGARSAVLGGKGLFGLLEEDEHLAPFLRIPGKDNGLDIEGIAVHGQPGSERVLLGLRGPVLRGWAVVLRLRPYEDDGELRLGKINGERYAKHFLDLGGLGIRDMCVHGEDLLLLAGPSMDLDGPVRVYRWRGAAGADPAEVVRGGDLHRELDLPYGDGDDHPEGLALLPSGELLVVYDSPAPHRLTEPGVVLADVFRLPNA